MATYKPGSISAMLSGGKDSNPTSLNSSAAELFHQPNIALKRKSTEKNANSETKKKRKKKDTPQDVKSDNEGVPEKPESMSDADVLENRLKRIITKKARGIDIRPAEKRILKNRRKSHQAENSGRTVFVGSLPIDCDKKTLLKLFRTYGKIESVRFRSAAPSAEKLPKKAVVIKKQFNKDSTVINAYVVFTEEESAKNAVELNGYVLDGEHLRVDLASADKKHDHEKSVFVGNLPFNAKDADVYDHFKDCGTIQSVRIVRDKFSGVGKGFGYVCFKDKESIDLAMCLSDIKFQNRKLRLERSSVQKKNSKGNLKSKGNMKDKSTVASVKKSSKDLKHKKTSLPTNAKRKDFEGIHAKQKLKMKAKKERRKKIAHFLKTEVGTSKGKHIRNKKKQKKGNK